MSCAKKATSVPSWCLIFSAIVVLPLPLPPQIPTTSGCDRSQAVCSAPPRPQEIKMVRQVWRAPRAAGWARRRGEAKARAHLGWRGLFLCFGGRRQVAPADCRGGGRGGGRHPGCIPAGGGDEDQAMAEHVFENEEGDDALRRFGPGRGLDRACYRSPGPGSTIVCSICAAQERYTPYNGVHHDVPVRRCMAGSRRAPGSHRICTAVYTTILYTLLTNTGNSVRLSTHGSQAEDFEIVRVSMDVLVLNLVWEPSII
eukprot:SAG22_NODE_55_length_23749_cov_24.622918_10_plen_256_part_00